MTTIYTFPALYTRTGVSASPTSDPTVSVISSGNTLLVSASACTKLTNLVGNYYYSYSGADNLICWAIFHTTDATVDQQDIGSYNPTNILSTTLDLISASATNIYNDMPDVTDIWTSATRTLTSASGLGLASGSSVDAITGTSASTIWAYGTRTLTSASSVLGAVVEGTYTVQDILKIMVASLAGKATGGGTTSITFRDLSNALDRIKATVDENGNRSAVTLDLS